MVSSWIKIPSWSEIFILYPDTCNFSCFGTISLILKCEKLMQRSAISNKAADWQQTSTRNFIKNNTHQQFFKFYNEVHIVLKCIVHYTVSVLTFSFHPVFAIFPKVISELQIQWYIDKISPSHAFGGYNSLLACAR